MPTPETNKHQGTQNEAAAADHQSRGSDEARLDGPVRVAGLRRARKQTWCYRGWFHNDLVKTGGERPAEDR